MKNHSLENIRLPKTGFHCSATYRMASPDELPSHHNNPLIEALPSLISQEQIENHTKAIPILSRKTICELSTEVRVMAINEISNLRIPLPQFTRFYHGVAGALRKGYVPRNPFDSEALRRFREAYKNLSQKNPIFLPVLPENSTCIGVFGDSGVGKTTMIDRILNLFPQVIHHHEYNGKPLELKQVTWLRLECPSRSNVSVLLKDFFLALNFALKDIETAEKEINKKISWDINRLRVTMKSHTHKIGVLVIDEVQRLRIIKSSSKRKSDGKENFGGEERHLLNFLTSLANTINLPIIFCGTREAEDVLNQDFGLCRRTSSPFNISFQRLMPGGDLELFLNDLWPYQFTDEFAPRDAQLTKALFHESQGNIDLLVRIFILSQYEVLVGKGTKITSEIIAKAARMLPTTLQGYVAALQTGFEPPSSPLDEGLEPLNFDSFVTQRNSSSSNTPSRKPSPIVKTSDPKTSIIAMLRKNGCTLEQAAQIAFETMKKHQQPNIDISTLFGTALQLLKKTSDPSNPASESASHN